MADTQAPEKKHIALVPVLRSKFRSDFTDKPSCYPEDVERIEKDDVYLHQFLSHQFGDVNKSYKLLTDCLKWRKQFGVRGIKEADIPQHLFEKGVMYFHNKDDKGCSLLWFNVQLHNKSKDCEASKKFLVYLIEQANREAPDKQLTILMDFTNTGLFHNDMSFMRFLVDCFQTHFPDFMNYLVAFNMPWILNASWKIIKLWLAKDEVEKVKFVDLKTIKDCIPLDQLPPHMGGTDEFKYTYKSPTSG